MPRSRPGRGRVLNTVLRSDPSLMTIDDVSRLSGASRDTIVYHDDELRPTKVRTSAKREQYVRIYDRAVATAWSTAYRANAERVGCSCERCFAAGGNVHVSIAQSGRKPQPRRLDDRIVSVGRMRIQHARRHWTAGGAMYTRRADGRLARVTAEIAALIEAREALVDLLVTHAKGASHDDR
jgi:hypothetical protein